MAKPAAGRRFTKGEVIHDRYEVVRKLGEGGCGAVYRCTDLLKEHDVAVKVLENPAEFQRFRREAKVMQRAKSEHVVRYLHHGQHDKSLNYLVMEFMDGGSLRDLLDRRGKLPVEEAAWILLQAIQGLKKAGTVHRDLKPENLLLAKGSGGKGLTLKIGDTEEGATVKVADFGLAKSKDPASLALTLSGQVMGTPVYMSPEQCRNTKRVSVRSDIYSLGIIFFEMLSQRVPFDGNNVYDIMEAQVKEQPKLGHLPAAARPVIDRCLQKEPGQRYPTLAALERDLLKLTGIRARVGGSRAWLFVVLVLLLLAGLAVAAWLLREELVGWFQRLGGA